MLVKLSFEKIKVIKRKENTKIEKKRSISFCYHVIHVHLLIHNYTVVFIPTANNTRITNEYFFHSAI